MSTTTARASRSRSAPRGDGEIGSVRRVAVPASARKLCRRANVDYEDAFEVQTGAAGDRTAEQWAREIFEDAPIGTRLGLRAAWFLLAAKLGSDPPERFVFGLEIVRSAPEFVLLAVNSRLGASADLLLERRSRSLLFTTFVQLDTRAARAVWAGAASGHRFAVRYLFGTGARRIREKEGKR